jgi:hypothetical protein
VRVRERNITNGVRSAFWHRYKIKIKRSTCSVTSQIASETWSQVMSTSILLQNLSCLVVDTKDVTSSSYGCFHTRGNRSRHLTHNP